MQAGPSCLLASKLAVSAHMAHLLLLLLLLLPWQDGGGNFVLDVIMQYKSANGLNSSTTTKHTHTQSHTHRHSQCAGGGSWHWVSWMRWMSPRSHVRCKGDCATRTNAPLFVAANRPAKLPNLIRNDNRSSEKAAEKRERVAASDKQWQCLPSN